MRPQTKLFAVKFGWILEVRRSQALQKKSGHNFTIYESNTEAVCCEVETHFGSFVLARFVRKNSGHIFMIYASESEAVCFDVYTHLGSFHLARFIKHALGAFLQFHVSTNLCCLVQTHCEVLDFAFY